MPMRVIQRTSSTSGFRHDAALETIIHACQACMSPLRHFIAFRAYPASGQRIMHEIKQLRYVVDPTRINATTTGSNSMNCFVKAWLASSLRHSARWQRRRSLQPVPPQPPSVNEGELLNLGFKVLVATTKVQQDWVRSLAPGKIRSMQRNGKKFFIYPDASRNRIFVGGHAEYGHIGSCREGDGRCRIPPTRRARTGDQGAAMRAATAHDLSDPFLGASSHLGW